MAPLEKAPPAANVIDAGCSNGLNYPTVIPLHIDDPTPTLPIKPSWNSSTWPGILDYLLPRCRMVVEDLQDHGLRSAHARRQILHHVPFLGIFFLS